MTTEQIKKLLSNFCVGKITHIKAVATTGNISYKITTEKGDYFLRLSPEEPMRGRSIDEILAEAEFLNYLHKSNLPILPPLMGKNGFIISADNKNGYLRRYSHGVPVTEPTVQQMRMFGQLLARMHRVSEGFIASYERTHIWDLPHTLQNLLEDEKLITDGLRDGGSFYRQLKNSLLDINQESELPKGMIHEDLGRRHVLWADGKIDAVIDFDRCYRGNVVDDLGQAIRGWCFTEKGEFVKVTIKY